jgi:ABC-type sulfate transport system permease component
MVQSLKGHAILHTEDSLRRDKCEAFKLSLWFLMIGFLIGVGSHLLWALILKYPLYEVHIGCLSFSINLQFYVPVICLFFGLVLLYITVRNYFPADIQETKNMKK